MRRAFVDDSPSSRCVVGGASSGELNNQHGGDEDRRRLTTTRPRGRFAREDRRGREFDGARRGGGRNDGDVTDGRRRRHRCRWHDVRASPIPSTERPPGHCPYSVGMPRKCRTGAGPYPRRGRKSSRTTMAMLLAIHRRSSCGRRGGKTKPTIPSSTIVERDERYRGWGRRRSGNR